MVSISSGLATPTTTAVPAGPNRILRLNGRISTTNDPEGIVCSQAVSQCEDLIDGIAILCFDTMRCPKLLCQF